MTTSISFRSKGSVNALPSLEAKPVSAKLLDIPHLSKHMKNSNIPLDAEVKEFKTILAELDRNTRMQSEVKEEQEYLKNNPHFNKLRIVGSALLILVSTVLLVAGVAGIILSFSVMITPVTFGLLERKIAVLMYLGSLFIVPVGAAGLMVGVKMLSRSFANLDGEIATLDEKNKALLDLFQTEDGKQRLEVLKAHYEQEFIEANLDGSDKTREADLTKHNGAVNHLNRIEKLQALIIAAKPVNSEAHENVKTLIDNYRNPGPTTSDTNHWDLLHTKITEMSEEELNQVLLDLMASGDFEDVRLVLRIINSGPGQA